MKKPPAYWNKAKIQLSKKDKIIKKLIKKYNSGYLISRNDIFFSLCKSIVGQQISVAAANSVFDRFKLLCKGNIRPKIVNKLTFINLKKWTSTDRSQCAQGRRSVDGRAETAARSH